MWPASGFWWSLIVAALAISLGPVVSLLLFQIGQATLYLLSAFFFAEGMAEFTYALDQRLERSQPWRWMLLSVSGAADLLVGVNFLLWWLYPPFPLIRMVIIVITLFFGGATMVAVALAARGGSEAGARA